MMNLFFIRHAEPDYSIKDDYLRPLTEKGVKDSETLIHVFKERTIHAIYSSPYIRAVDTVTPLAKSQNLKVNIINDLRERKITDHWIEDFQAFTKNQWQDFSYHLPKGESLAVVQRRNIAVIKELLTRHTDETVVIGTHGTSLSTIIQYFEPDFGLTDFLALKDKMPLVIEMTFKDGIYQDFKEVDYV